MFLREMFDIMDERYKAQDDASIIRFDDLRKTKLTLEQINQIRKEAVDIAVIPDNVRIIKDFMFPSPNLMRVLVVQPEQKVIPIPNSSPPDIEDIVLSLIFM